MTVSVEEAKERLQHEPKPWSRVSFSVFSDELTPLEISDILGEETYDNYLKGDPVSSRRPEGPFRQQNHWAITLDTDTELTFEEHLKNMLDFVDEKSAQIIQLRDQCEMRIFCSSTVINRCGFELSLSQIELLARTKVRIGFDLAT